LTAKQNYLEQMIKENKQTTDPRIANELKKIQSWMNDTSPQIQR